MSTILKKGKVLYLENYKKIKPKIFLFLTEWIGKQGGLHGNFIEGFQKG